MGAMEQRHRSTWKGERRQVGTKVPVELYDAIRERADRLGVTMADVMYAALARDLMPDLDPLKDKADLPEQMAMTA